MIFGIKIFTRTTANDSSLGLYSGTIKLVQNPVTGEEANWTSGLISLNGLKEYNSEVDITSGGNIEKQGKFSIEITNVNNLFQQYLNLGIKLDGCVVELWKVDTSVRVWIGRCVRPEVDQRTIKVSAVKLGQGRVSQLVSEINADDYPYASTDIINKPIPVTFGKMYPVYNDYGDLMIQSIAEFVRTADKQDETIFTNAYFTQAEEYPEIIIFPVISYTAATGSFNFQLTGTCKVISVAPADTYVIVVAGTGAGQIKQVTSINCSYTNYVTVNVKDLFETDLVATNGTTQAWIKIVKIYRTYKADTWPCLSPLEHSTGSSVSVAETYVEENDKIQRIADYGFNINISNNNSLDIDGEQFSDDIDKIDSFLILPVTSLSKVDSSDLSQWPVSYSYTKYAAGIYIKDLTINEPPDDTLYNPENAYDKNSLSFASFSPNLAVLVPIPPGQYALALKFQLPIIPKNLDIDEIYFGIRSKIAAVCDIGVKSRVILSMRRHNNSNNNDRLIFDRTEGNDPNTEDLPDYYYFDKPANQNKNFFKTTTSPWNNIFGYSLFKLTNCNHDVYNTFVEGAIILENRSVQTTGKTYTNTMKIYELAIIIKVGSSNIKSKIYSPLAGRIYNSTWGGRVPAAEVIKKPKHIFEHVCRLQNFSESTIQPSSGWGKEYSATPLINTVQIDALTNTDALEAVKQIKEFNDGFTDQIKISLCRSFHWINWHDADGLECLADIFPDSYDVKVAITLADVVDRQSVQVNPWPPDKVFPDITVRYAKDSVKGEYEKSIVVSHSDAASYDSSYVKGISNPSVAEAIWNLAHDVYLQSEKSEINKPPSTMTDVDWTDGTTGYSIAVRYLLKMLTMMTCKVLELKVSHQLADMLDLGSWFTFNSTKHTGGVTRHCMVIAITSNPNPPYVTVIKAMMIPKEV